LRKLIDGANKAIRAQNDLIANRESEKRKLANEVWIYLLEVELKSDLAAYKKEFGDIRKAIASLDDQIATKNKEKHEKNTLIQNLEKGATSIQPTIDAINSLLRSFGFTGFKLAKSEQDRFYKIQRSDGTDAHETLSEGEKTFITFLYFYHLLKGSNSEIGITTNRVVVFDDPVSSLDSDILFIVSSLIRGLFDEVRSEKGTIKQIFVLTHNVYFHKEVSFRSKRQSPSKGEESFWTVKKLDNSSRIKRHDSNPIKSSYELLWVDVKKPGGLNHTIQNTLRRIIENYFKIVGSNHRDDVCKEFEGNEQLICGSLFSWVNDGSHSAHEDLYHTIDEQTVEKYLCVFKQIFEKTGHKAHYDMMMQ
jgi:wobble nucleotide-excising tRNase